MTIMYSVECRVTDGVVDILPNADIGLALVIYSEIFLNLRG